MKFDAANKRVHLVREYQSGPTVSHSEKNETSETLIREGISMGLFSLEDLQQHFGGRREDAAKSLGYIYGPGFHMPDSLAWKSLEVLETLLLGELPNDFIHLKSLRRVTLKNFARLQKIPELPRTLQIYAVEERVTQLPRCFGGLTCQSACSTHWPIGLPDGGQIVQLDSLEQSINIVAHGARADQSCPTVPLLEKKIVRKTIKRKCRTMRVDLQQHVGGRSADAAKSLGVCVSTVKRFCGQHGIHCLSTVKRIYRRHGIHRWPFQQSASSSHWPIVSPDGRQIVHLDSLERSTNNVARGAREDQSCHTVSLSEKKIVRRTLKGKCKTKRVISFEDLKQHFGTRCEVSVKSLGVKHGLHRLSAIKRIRRQHGIHRWPFRQRLATMKWCSLVVEISVEVINLSRDEKLDSRLQFIHIPQLARSSPRPVTSPDGGEIVGPIALSCSEFAATNNRANLVREDQNGSTASRSEKKKTRKTSNREWTTKISLSLEDLQQHFGSSRKDAAKSLDVSESTLKRICRQHDILRWPYRQKNNVWKPPDPQGEKNTSSTCTASSTHGQTDMENEMVGNLEQQTGFLPGLSEDPNCWNTANGGSSEWAPQSTLFTAYANPNNIAFPLLQIESAQMSIVPDMSFSIASTYKGSEVGGSSIGASQLKDQSILSTVYPNPNAQPQIGSTQTLSVDMESSEDWRNFLAPEVSEFGNWTVPSGSDPAPSQPTMPPIPDTMPAIPQMTPQLAASQDTRSVKLKASYGDLVIKFQLSLASGFVELKEQVSKRLELEVGSFWVLYQDEGQEWIVIGCDDDLRECLKRWSSLGNQDIRLLVRDEARNSCNCSRALRRKKR